MRRILISTVIGFAFAVTGVAEESRIHAASTKSKNSAAKPKSMIISTAPTARSTAPMARSIAPVLTADSPMVALAKKTKSSRKLSASKMPVIINNETVKTSKGIISEAAANNNFSSSSYGTSSSSTPNTTAAAPPAMSSEKTTAAPPARGARDIATEQSFVNDQINDPTPNAMDPDAAERRMYELQQEQESQKAPPAPKP